MITATPLLDAGAMEVMAVMRNYPRDDYLQGTALEAINDLAARADTMTRLGELGAVGAVLTVMRTHPAVVRIQRNGLCAIGNFAADVINQSVLFAHGADEAVLAAMHKHPADACIQSNGAHALCNMSGWGHFIDYASDASH